MNKIGIAVLFIMFIAVMHSVETTGEYSKIRFALEVLAKSKINDLKVPVTSLCWFNSFVVMVYLLTLYIADESATCTLFYKLYLGTLL